MSLVTPTWTATFARPLLDQIIALVQRDQATAISIVNPEITDQIVQFHKGYAPRIQLPHFTVWAHGTEFSLEEQLARRSTNDITVQVDVGPLDQELAQELAWAWARVIDIIITSAAPEDWWTPLPIQFFDQPAPATTSPPAQGTLLAVLPLRIVISSALVEGQDKPVIRAEWWGRFELEEAGVGVTEEGAYAPPVGYAMQYEETPSGAINGVNTVFTLQFAPSPPTSLVLTLNGLIQEQGANDDYTLSGNEITFIEPPPAGSRILAVEYQYET